MTSRARFRLISAASLRSPFNCTGYYYLLTCIHLAEVLRSVWYFFAFICSNCFVLSLSFLFLSVFTVFVSFGVIGLGENIASSLRFYSSLSVIMEQDNSDVKGAGVRANSTSGWASISPSIQAATTDSATPTTAQSAWIIATASGSPPSESSTAGVDNLGLSGRNRGIIIGSVVGGVAGIGIILVLALCLLGTRRKAKKQRAAETKKRLTEESRTYTGLNQYFAGVPFRRTEQTHDAKLLPSIQSPSPAHSPTTSGRPDVRDGTVTRSPSPYLISPRASLRMVPSDLGLLHSFIDGAESSPNTLGRSLSARESNKEFRYSRDLPATPTRSVSERVTSRFSVPMESPRISTVEEVSLSSPNKAADSLRTTSGQTLSKRTTPNLSRSPNSSDSIPPRFPFHYGTRDTVDTMGFPVESDTTEPPWSPYTDVPIISPVPRSPLHKQKRVLERVASGDVTTTTPSPLSNIALRALRRQSSESNGSLYHPYSVSQPADSKHTRSNTTASQKLINEIQIARESPVLGMKGPPVKISPSQGNFPPQAHGNRSKDTSKRQGSLKSNLSVTSTYSK
jgi:hypothetical protein